MTQAETRTTGPAISGRMWTILAIVLSVAMMALLILAGHSYLTKAFSEEHKADAVRRATLYASAIKSEMDRLKIVPLLLSRDPILMIGLRSEQYDPATERLSSFREEIGAEAIFLLDMEGRVVASSDPNLMGTDQSDSAFFTRSLVSAGTEFSMIEADDASLSFHQSQTIIVDEEPRGVIVVTADLGSTEDAWRLGSSRIMVTDSEGEILLASEPAWRRTSLSTLLSPEPGASIMNWSLWTPESELGEQPYVVLAGTRYLQAGVPIGFRNWRLNMLSTMDAVQARVNGVLSMGVMVLALLMALSLFVVSRKTKAESQRFQRETSELRLLNRRLSEEVAARRRVERDLEEAEQSLEQASKLAALGQMSAAVSHELNQPLAAAKTYLAGAKLLLQRRRPDEALSSFQRIDALINRMGGITRQLKSYAHKGDKTTELVDLRGSVREALALMAPQLAKTPVEITTTLPRDPVFVEVDPIRIEQIVVNLLRNAVDAVLDRDNPTIKILLVEGEAVLLSVEDNGSGIRDPDKLFEPFYTTKRPGEGLGLGLAISAGFAAEFGGRLVARNKADGGAEFELTLPRARQPSRKAG